MKVRKKHVQILYVNMKCIFLGVDMGIQGSVYDVLCGHVKKMRSWWGVV